MTRWPPLSQAAVHVRADDLRAGDFVEGEGRLAEDPQPHHKDWVNLTFHGSAFTDKKRVYSCHGSTLKLVRTDGQ